MEALATRLTLPDPWQHQALRALRQGRSVVVDAPTGAGKTYIFELLIEQHFRGRAIYTVPTRALANDKLMEWRAKGWNVGITTGDLSENPAAPVIVATLETQKRRLAAGTGPDLLVIDEFQMLGDSSRGVSYEIALATAPPGTQLLLLSGTVGNPGSVANWLRRLGRDVEEVHCAVRPVPQEEVQVEAIRERIPAHIGGFWPRVVAKALRAKLGPLLVFAPRRRAAEELARQLAHALPEREPLELTSEQREVAGEGLSRMLRQRIAFHHSGLGYRQRAGLIEPLAKAGQLRVVVATTGLASGINFSLRSVLVTDREYRHGGEHRLLRPDELQQMFGRAGRRGMDERGYILAVPGKPRLSEAQPIHLRRPPQLDWPTLIAVMARAVDQGEDPAEAAESLAARLFSHEPILLGLRELVDQGKPDRAGMATPSLSGGAEKTRFLRRAITEMLNSAGEWERLPAPRPIPLSEALVHDGQRWRPALGQPDCLKQLAPGMPCRIPSLPAEEPPIHGTELPIASIPRKEGAPELRLSRWVREQLRHEAASPTEGNKAPSSRSRRREGSQGHGPRRKRFEGSWTLERLEREIVPRLPNWTGGKLCSLETRGNQIFARLDFRQSLAFAHLDSEGRSLINPPRRERPDNDPVGFALLAGYTQAQEGGNDRTVARIWRRLGLIDRDGHPTRRGRVFSFFNHGEGLAVAAALEEPSYGLEDLLGDLANLRAGHRFEPFEDFSSRLAAACRALYGNTSYAGYLRQGVPEDYGNGAAEALADPALIRKSRLAEQLAGDLERVRLEWRGLLQQAVSAPALEWPRWQEFQRLGRERLESLNTGENPLLELPPLTFAQRNRIKSHLEFS